MCVVDTIGDLRHRRGIDVDGPDRPVVAARDRDRAAVRRPRRPMTGVSAIRLALVGEALGELAQAAARGIDHPQVGDAQLVRVEGNLAAIGAPAGEAGERVESGDLVTVRAIGVHQPDLAQVGGTRVERELRAIWTPHRVAIVRLIVAELERIATVNVHRPDLVLPAITIALEGDALAVGAPDRPHVLRAIDGQLEQRRLAFFGQHQTGADQAEPERQEQGPSCGKPPRPRRHRIILGSSHASGQRPRFVILRGACDPQDPRARASPASGSFAALRMTKVSCRRRGAARPASARSRAARDRAPTSPRGSADAARG